jgi:carbamoyl-phosphate synthase large subunit
MMRIENILITSAGRRVRLVQNFQEALKRYNPKGKVLTTDMHPELSSACQLSDGSFKLPRVSDEGYLDRLLAQCLANRISLVVPTIDTELGILARAKPRFEAAGVRLAISSPECCDTFYRKRSTEAFFTRCGVDTPRIVDPFEGCTYPLFAKLDNSSCSIGAGIVQTEVEASKLVQAGDYVFQELIDGDEYTVDLFMDRHGNAICIVPRKRLEVRAGEVSKALTVKDAAIMDAVKSLVPYLKGAYGCITVQLFKSDQRIVFIEINPRFGGGYPLTWQSGADFAAMLIEDTLGHDLAYTDAWRDGVLMLRYDAEVIVW